MAGCSICGSTQNQATPKLCQPCVDHMRMSLQRMHRVVAQELRDLQTAGKKPSRTSFSPGSSGTKAYRAAIDLIAEPIENVFFDEMAEFVSTSMGVMGPPAVAAALPSPTFKKGDVVEWLRDPYDPKSGETAVVRGAPVKGLKIMTICLHTGIVVSVHVDRCTLVKYAAPPPPNSQSYPGFSVGTRVQMNQAWKKRTKRDPGSGIVVDEVEWDRHRTSGTADPDQVLVKFDKPNNCGRSNATTHQYWQYAAKDLMLELQSVLLQPAGPLPALAPARLFKKGDRVKHANGWTGMINRDQGKALSFVSAIRDNQISNSLYSCDPAKLTLITEGTKDCPGLAKVADKEYPHTCTRCGAPSFNGAVGVDCSKKCGVRAMMTTT